MKDSLGKILISSKRSPKLIETARGKEFYNNIFQNFLNNINYKHYSRNTDKEAVSAERYNRILGDLFEKPFLEKGECNWIHVFPVITK